MDSTHTPCDFCHEHPAIDRVEVDGQAEADLCALCIADLEPGDEYAETLAFEREHAVGVL